MFQRYGLGRYLGGAACARTGDEMSGPALLLWGMALTGSVNAGSSLLAGFTAAAALGGPVVGVVLDRCARPGRLLAVVLGVYAAGSALVCLCLGRLPLAVVVGLAVATGLVGPALSGGWTAHLPRVAAPGSLARATAWDAMTFGAAALLGPALVGVVAAVAGAGAAVATTVFLMALAVPLAWALPAREPRQAQGSVVGDLLAGMRKVVGARALLRVTAVTTLSIAGTGMVVVCAPVVGLRLLGGQENGALLLSGMAVCSLLANLVLARRPPPVRPDTVIVVCVLAQAAGTAALGLAGPPPSCSSAPPWWGRPRGLGSRRITTGFGGRDVTSRAGGGGSLTSLGVRCGGRRTAPARACTGSSGTRRAGGRWRPRCYRAG